MTCTNCNYVMCYICRKDIRVEGYSHFCEHFRIVAGSICDQCTKCELYQKEFDKMVVKKAGQEARKEWLEKNPDNAQKVINHTIDW
jgi:hypothetical protein